MSRKGVTTKRVKTVQTALSRISAQTAQSGWPRNECSTLGQISSVREVSAKVQNRSAARITTRETIARGRPRHNATPQPRTTKRASREQASRPRNSRVPRPTPSEPGNYVPRPAENFIGQSSSVRPQRPTTNPSGHDRSDRTAHDPIIRPIVPTDRPNAAVDPKPVLKPDFIFSSPA
ncbi:unnamed protein product [Microthlaspi erraticum]|uniref:Uncharacterized protein n=1 Tax=Microthlaspi erraticum TaxID=1685480 RepID=A0A6D2IW75_9BRAS|nr:unnamed protein product [Microthlaspi erraticum]